MIKTADPKIPTVAVDGTTPLTAEQIVEHLRMLRGHIPDFAPLPIPTSRTLHVTANIPAEFLQASFNTVGAAKPIADALLSDAPTLLTESTDVGRWSAVEDELRTMLQGMAASNLARRYRLGLTALQTYHIARQLVRKKEHADLLPHVQIMRRLNPFGRKRAAQNPAKPTAPAPVPAPTTPVKSS
jgi:hypothetical protein